MKSRGFFTIAQGEAYQRMAYALALSLKISQPKHLSKLSIGVTAEEIDKVNPKYLKVFDQVIEIPWEDHAAKSSWKLENEWKAIYMTPYDETIKLDADMIFPSDISNWWDILSHSDAVFCTTAMTYRGEEITNDYYRKTFTESDLPNVYSAMFYFNKNEINYEFFKLAEDIFNNWQLYFYEFLAPDNRPTIVSTDVVFALAAKILDFTRHNRAPHLNIPTFIHMKSQLQGWPDDRSMMEDWTKIIPSYFDKNANTMIGNYKINLPFHYHVKHFMTDEMIATMEAKLGL